MNSELYKKTEAYLQAHPDARQALSVVSAKGNFYQFSNSRIRDGDTSDEKRFVQLLRDREDTQVCKLLCMWKSGQVDIPSSHLRRELLRLDPANRETEIALQGEKGLVTRKLGEIK